eukprot:TRINITY_DN4610_c0_g2_i1.p1 TRINITY_DN4610_c0_g2~~TRINITY_DN4610_c0_g2_i1.p1  ORF type:complete len:265 (+),score=73.02 TRINITY_DN4610_c0_g2_i1:758-1552(+)
MSSSEGESIGEVTGHGFNFLLQSTQTQLWRFCLAYVAGCPHPEQVLRLLFALSCARVLRLADLSSAQLEALSVLHQIGLVCSSDTELRGSRLAEQLRCHACSSTEAAVLVEQNFRVCVRGDSRLLVCLASLFGVVECQLPDLTVLSVTRQSVSSAVRFGISVEQIVSFLEGHCPQDFPQNVGDQILLWGAEEKRAAMESCVHYDQFESQELYAQTVQYAKQIQAHLWSDHTQRVLLLKAEFHAQVKQHVLKLKEDSPETQALYA